MGLPPIFEQGLRASQIGNSSCCLKLLQVYDRLVLQQPLGTLIAVTMVAVFFLLHIPEFELDASADSLVLENDTSLKYYRGVREQYGSDDFLIVTYSPQQALFSEQVLADITRLRDELNSLEQVASVISLLDVPLVDSPPMTLGEISRKRTHAGKRRRRHPACRAGNAAQSVV